MSDQTNPPSTGYENALRSALPTFDGSASSWNRWKRRFLVYMTEMSLKRDLLDENKQNEEKQAKIARLLLIALQGTAADIVYSQTDDDTPGHDIWTLLCSTYEAETTSSIAALTEQFFALEPPSSPAEVQAYINKTMELRSQIKSISPNDAPSDAMVYGKVKRGLHNIKELAAYSDTLDHVSKSLQEKVTFIQQKAQSMASPSDQPQAFAAQGTYKGQQHRQRENRPRPQNHQQSQQPRQISHQQPQNQNQPHCQQRGSQHSHSSNKFKGPPRHIFRCTYHKTNGHTTAECRDVKAIMAANSAQLNQRTAQQQTQQSPDEFFGWSSQFGDDEWSAHLSNTEDDEPIINPTLAEYYEPLHASAAIADRTPLIQVDSCASHHMIIEREAFKTYNLLPQGSKIKLAAKGSHAPAVARGNVDFTWTDLSGVSHCITIEAVHAPTFSANLFSVPFARKQGWKIAFDDHPKITSPDGKVFPMHSQGPFFTISPKISPQISAAAAHIDADTWHRRLGHISPGKLALLKQHGCIDGCIPNQFNCDACNQSKISRHPQSRDAVPKADYPGQKVHFDYKGPLTQSVNGDTGFYNFVDSYTGMTFAFPVSKKTDLYEVLDNSHLRDPQVERDQHQH